MALTLDMHPHARSVLGPALDPAQAARPSHAYLFHGPGGAGKRELARQFAAELLAEGARDPSSAHARALAGAHPDLTWVAPSGAHEILVSDIDGPVVAAATRTPFESSRRVFVIESADQLGDESANRMLKTLEEPASYVHLILVTDRLGEVLPTIRSRCQLVRFDGPSIDALAAELQAGGAEGDQARACALLSLGDAGVARELATAEGRALRGAAEAYAGAVLTGRSAALAPWTGVLDAVRARGASIGAELEERAAAELEMVPRKERKRLEREWEDRAKRSVRRTQTQALALVLSLLEAWLLDLAQIGWGAGQQIRHTDRRAQLEAIDPPAPAALIAAVALVEGTRVRLPLNVTEALALEALAYRLEEELST